MMVEQGIDLWVWLNVIRGHFIAMLLLFLEQQDVVFL